MKVKKNHRNFGIIEFKDVYGAECSLQKSSLVNPCIWLGVDKADYIKEGKLPRMHLDIKTVKKLLPHLQKFVETGDIS